VFKTEKDSIMETTAYTSDNIITRSYEEYHQVILNYITYRENDEAYRKQPLEMDTFGFEELLKEDYYTND
jgi:hypothetical protein